MAAVEAHLGQHLLCPIASHSRINNDPGIMERLRGMTLLFQAGQPKEMKEVSRVHLLSVPAKTRISQPFLPPRAPSCAFAGTFRAFLQQQRERNPSSGFSLKKGPEALFQLNMAPKPQCSSWGKMKALDKPRTQGNPPLELRKLMQLCRKQQF